MDKCNSEIDCFEYIAEATGRNVELHGDVYSIVIDKYHEFDKAFIFYKTINKSSPFSVYLSLCQKCENLNQGLQVIDEVDINININPTAQRNIMTKVFQLPIKEDFIVNDFLTWYWGLQYKPAELLNSLVKNLDKANRMNDALKIRRDELLAPLPPICCGI